MGTLSTSATSSSSGGSSGGAGRELDEQHVSCALEILRVAGAFKRDLGSFEQSVRNRLRSLSVEMGDAALEGAGGGGAAPDELPPARIRAMLAREACDPSTALVDDGTGVRLPAPVVELRRLAGPAAGSSSAKALPAALTPLFPRAHDATSRLARSCLSLVFEVCYAVPERHLRSISALPVWKEEGSGANDAGDGEEGEESYGILPQPFITHVGEHMLALVQALEPFASDPDALGLANEVMSGVMEVAVQPWKEFVAAAGSSFGAGDERAPLDILMRGKDLSKYLNADEALDDSAMADHDEEDEGDADARESAAFCNQWLDVVGLAVAGRLLERTMRIPRLGRRGAEHLATDLNYVRNVFTALGVAGHPHPLLGYVTQLVTLDEESLRSKIQHRRGETDLSPALEVIKRAELRIAYVRGVSV